MSKSEIYIISLYAGDCHVKVVERDAELVDELKRRFKAYRSKIICELKEGILKTSFWNEITLIFNAIFKKPLRFIFYHTKISSKIGILDF